MTEKKSVTLATPVTIDGREVISLQVVVPFRTGFLRGAPATPAWFITTVKALMSKAAAIEPPKDGEAPVIDDAALLADLDIWPQGGDIDAMAPWLMHVAEKATGEAPATIDQLTLGDLLKIIMLQLPGMMQLANFRMTSPTGAGTSQGSLAGAPAK